MTDNLEKAYFAGGCFWGVEYHFQNLPGVISTRVGYMGGEKERPTYAEVSSGATGHAETLEVVFDRTQTNFAMLAKLFFEIHDPTQRNRQGPDIGTQYRSAIFFTSAEQRETAQQLIAFLKNQGLKVATELIAAGTFWEAEGYHQKYYTQGGGEPYCHIRQQRF